MKNLTLLLLGAFVGWLIIGFFKDNYDPSTLFIFILGAISGFQIRKNK
ncbi:tRNA U-34 5-methylaminomethyl-2-thiouridine biosynthesis protein [Bacillus cytotoxicus]|uniref:tRNA U-34 5-methylaminomethyl-2-thiouridine biosynthesis protein n=1 Tax=Bacillus cytotoxicus TaxID=580165 RepID=A0ACC6A3U6_9BACI|nr:tRNA U-34 5-methylaminomethyl-2-thiouridine biosynthesis protein [Bacillus cytotoxicus]